MVYSLLSYAVAAVSLVWSVSALDIDMNIVNAQVEPDGFSRPAVLADGVYPGPLLTLNKGEDFRVNVINQLNDSSMLQGTSVHWHGFFQSGTNWADGPAFVNQCPISPSHSFLYNFNVGDQAGSYWYHSHYSTQYCDGLRGPIVVYDPADPHASLYDVDDASTVITFSDWYHTQAPSAGVLPNPDSHLINGLGRWNNGGTIAPTPLSVVNVQPGQSYRLRLISLACDASYDFSIDGHTMTVIEADGVSTEPLEVDSITVFAAQRYSVVVTANQGSGPGNFWIRARPSKGDTSFTGGLNSAILRYTDAADVEPTTTQTPSTNPFREFNLHTLNHPGVPGGASPGDVDVPMTLPVGFNAAALEFTLNGTAYHSPNIPVLLQILSGVTDPAALLPSGSVIPLPENQVIEITIPGGGNHPFHLHGHNFDVIRSAGSSAYNFVNPVRRDVVSIGAGGDSVTIRFVTDNPGPWFFHCHIEWHLEAGLAVVFAEDIPNIASANPVPQDWQDLCPTFEDENPDNL